MFFAMFLVDNIFSAKFLQQVQSNILTHSKSLAEETPLAKSPSNSPTHQTSQCPISTLIIILHGGSILDVANEANNAKSMDITTFTNTLDSVLRQHYLNLIGRISVRYVACPSICQDSLMVLSSLSPYNVQSSPATEGLSQTFGSIPFGALPLFAISALDYQENVVHVISQCNKVYADFLKSDEGKGFTGKVALLGDSVGAILGFDALCHGTSQANAYGSELSIHETPEGGKSMQHSNPIISITDSVNSLNLDSETSPEQMNALCKSRTLPTSSSAKSSQPTKPQVYCKSLSHPGDSGSSGDVSNRLLISTAIRRRSSGSSDLASVKLEFEVNDFFMCGSLLGIVLTYRKMLSLDDKTCKGPVMELSFFWIVS